MTVEPRRGLLESADGRTVLLKDVDHLPLQLQAKLLRVFQDGSFSRKGGNTPHPTDCRFITTSQRDLVEKVESNLFREDFFYRLNVVNIKIPALRDRPEDIESLLYEFVGRLGKNADSFSAEIKAHVLLPYLEKYSWPGNVRELRQVIEAIVLTDDWDAIRQVLLGRNAGSSKIAIERCIEFPPEYHQAGVSILSFFGEILRREFPEHKATVRIEQDGLKVRMIVEPLSGDPAIFERALDEYGLVLTGQITPEQFTDDRFLALSLKHELRLAHARIESQKELMHYQERYIDNRDRQIEMFMQLIGCAIQAPNPPSFNITVSPTISSVASTEVNITNSLVDIASDLDELTSILRGANENIAPVEEVKRELGEVRGRPGSELRDSSSFEKLRNLVARLSSAEDAVGKIIRTTKNGIETVQKLAKHYNQVAQWVGLPQVPRPFLGGDEAK